MKRELPQQPAPAAPLPDDLARRLDQAKPMIGWIILAVLAVFGAALVWGVVTSMHQASEAAAWNNFYLAAGSGDADQLGLVIEEYPNSTAAGWARQSVADSDLQKGSEALLVDRDEATELLNKAVKGYEELIGMTRDDSLKVRARMGLAQAYESLGNLEKAKQTWDEVAASNATEAFVKEAKRRSEWLAGTQGKAFYDWFATYKPAPKPQLNLPTDLNALPQTPDLSLPGLPPLTPPAKASEATPPADPNAAPPATPAPPAEAAPPADKPAEPAPSTDKPADAPAAPAAETPAAETPTAETPAAPEAPATPSPAPEATPAGGTGGSN
jgi:hypothetical protein